MELTFSADYESFGVVQTHDLKPDGRNISVTDANKQEYVQCVVWRARAATQHG